MPYASVVSVQARAAMQLCEQKQLYMVMAMLYADTPLFSMAYEKHRRLVAMGAA